MLRKTIRRRSTFSLLLLTLITQASWSTDKTSILFPRIGRVTFSAAGAGETPTGIFGGDVMQPVYGNDNGFLFADFMGDVATGNTYLLSPGVGYRHVVNNQILGAYFFGDNEKVSLGRNFWNLSPGIEWMTPHWDMHVNGYFPTTRTKSMGITPVFADTLGNYDYVYFVEGTHNQYDALTAPYDVIGNGGDLEIAYRFPFQNNLAARVYVGGYYYQPASDDFIPITHVKNITGVTAGFEQSLTKNIRVSFMNSYDSVNFYSLGFRVQLSFGDASTLYSDNVHDRLLEPVERHVGVIGTGAGTYDQLGYKNLGNALEYNNVYFMSPNGTGKGTYGDPMALSQLSLNTINAQNPNSSRLYLQGGNAATYAVNSANAGINGLELYNGQDLYGRSANYTAPAASSQRPIISVDGDTVNHGFYIQNGENTFDDLVITASSLNATENTAGIYAVTTTDATVNVVNTSITALNIGLSAKNNGTGNLAINTTNSQFNNNIDSVSGTGAYGIYASNNSTGNLTINATNSQFNGNTNSNSSNSDVAIGIYANNAAGNLIINATNSQFNGNTNSKNIADGAAGIYASNDTGNLTINATNSQFNGNTNTGISEWVSGIYASNDTGNLTINATHSQFNENSSTSVQATGLYISGLGTVNLNLTNSSFNGNTVTGPMNGGANGVFINVANLNMNVTNSTFNGNISDSQNAGSGGLISGIEAFISGTANINVTHSQFNGNQALNGTGGVQAAGFFVTNNGSANMVVNVSGSQFNDNVATGDGNGGAAGFSAFNTGSGSLTISAIQSQFNANKASGANNGGGEGFYVDNSAATGALSVTSLSGSVFDNNGNYGLFAAGNATPNTTVSLADTSFFGNPTNLGSSGEVTFTE